MRNLLLVLLAASALSPVWGKTEMKMGLIASLKDQEFNSYVYGDVGKLARKLGIKLVELRRKDLNPSVLAQRNLDGLFLAMYENELSAAELATLNKIEAATPAPNVLLWLVKPGFRKSPAPPEGLDAVTSPSAQDPAKRAVKGPLKKAFSKILQAHQAAAKN